MKKIVKIITITLILIITVASTALAETLIDRNVSLWAGEQYSYTVWLNEGEKIRTAVNGNDEDGKVAYQVYQCKWEKPWWSWSYRYTESKVAEKGAWFGLSNGKSEMFNSTGYMWYKAKESGDYKVVITNKLDKAASYKIEIVK